MSQALPAARIGRFQLRERLGAGAFGSVYRAYDPQLDREVALKVPRPGAVDDPRAVERFLREARAAARLSHPHIVPLYDAGREGDSPYIASGFVAGRSLDAVLEDGPLDPKRAARVAHGLAEALAHAHALGIVHRDVKPANVMLDEAGSPCLMDFGLAHLQGETQKLTQDGAVLGTPAYLAPEQAQGGNGPPAPAADQYGLGAVLYEMLCGQPPFRGPAEKVLYQVIHEATPSPRARNPKVPRDLETICRKAMAKRPEDRYASCQEMADDLRRWLEGEPVHARRLPAAVRLLRWARRDPALAAGVTAAALALVAVAAVTTVTASRYAGLVGSAREARRQAEALQREAEDARREAEEAERAEADARQKAIEQNEQTRLALARARQKAQDAAEAAEKEAAQAGKAREARALLEQKREAEAKATTEAAERQRLFEEALASRRALPLHTLPFRAACRSNLAFGPGGERLLLGVTTDLMLWDLKAGKAEVIGKHFTSVTGVAFSPDGKAVAAASREGVLKVWDMPRPKAPRFEIDTEARSPGILSPGSFSPDGGRLALACKTLQFRDAATGAALDVPPALAKSLRFVTFAAAGKRLAGVAPNGIPKCWDAKSGEEVLTLPNAMASVTVTGVSWDKDGRRLAMTAKGGAVVWDLKAENGVFSREGAVTAALSPDGTRVAFASGHEITVYDVDAGSRLWTFRKHTGEVLALAFSPDGRRLASVGADEAAYVWDASDPEDRPPPKP